MGKVDVFVFGQCFLNFIDLHSDLLNHGSARSQQVRITLNKFRLPQWNPDLSVVDADVTNTSFRGAVQLMIKAADQGYSHEGEEERLESNLKSIVPLCEKLLSPPDWIPGFTRAKENAAQCDHSHHRQD